MIERNVYLSKLISSKGNGFPKIITGVRRCGKLKPFFALKDSIQKIILINKPLEESLDLNVFTVIGIADFLLRFIK